MIRRADGHGRRRQAQVVTGNGVGVGQDFRGFFPVRPGRQPQQHLCTERALTIAHVLAGNRHILDDDAAVQQIAHFAGNLHRLADRHRMPGHDQGLARHGRGMNGLDGHLPGQTNSSLSACSVLEGCPRPGRQRILDGQFCRKIEFLPQERIPASPADGAAKLHLGRFRLYPGNANAGDNLHPF